MDTVIDFLKKCDLTALPDGKTVIDGERVFVNVMEADLREAEGVEYEYHKRYADLQIDISGSEYWEWTDKAEFTDTFQEASDCGLAAGRSRCGGTLGDGSFALFLPEEFHKPSCKNGSHTHVRKAVIKIDSTQVTNLNNSKEATHFLLVSLANYYVNNYYPPKEVNILIMKY